MKRAIFFFLTAVFFLTNCQDFLEEEALSDISLQQIYETPEGFLTGIVGLYSVNRELYKIWPNESSVPLWTHVQHDLVMPRSGYIAVIAKFDKSAMTPERYGSSLSKDIWRHHYKIIDRANALITAADGLTEMDDAIKNKAIGEARLLRAHSLFTLWRLYNNVYVTTTPTTPDNVFDRIIEPSTKEEIFAALHEDFDFAIAHLPWTDVAGRAHKGLAHHLKAKAAMWQEDYQTAADNAVALITNGPYSLEPNLKKIFGHPDEEGFGDRNSTEALFVIQNEQASAGAGPIHFLNVNFMTRYNNVEGAKYSKEQGGRGFGFVYPNQYLLSLYESFDKRLDAYYKTKFYYNDEDNLPEGVTLGDQIVIPNSGSDQAKYYERTSPSCLKFYDENIPVDAAVSYSNVLLYRLSETYLIAAEALMRLGDGGSAQNYLNALTARAGVPPSFGITENDIMKEQARELAFEGQRFYFLKRIGRLITQVQKFTGDDDFGNQGRANIKPHYINLPIPQSELDLLGVDYPQNEGY